MSIMNRGQNPSNGGNPFGQFNSMTSNTAPNMRNNGFYNFNNGFTQPNHPFIEKPDFQNKNNILHNNLGDSLLAEHIVEYQIHIDSADRTLTAYSNPFKYNVAFGGAPGKTKKVKKYRKKTDNGNDIYDYTEDVYFEGTPKPLVSRKFDNVKYVKLDYVILPRTIILTKDSSNNYVLTTSTNETLSKYKYLIVKIKELGSGRIISTNNVIGDDCFIIYPDKTLGTDFVLWVTSYGSRVFTNSNLGNISKLSLSILDPSGNELGVVDSTNNSTIDMSVIETGSDKYTEAQLASLTILNDYLQSNLSFIFGVVENELNTNTKYER